MSEPRLIRLGGFRGYKKIGIMKMKRACSSKAAGKLDTVILTHQPIKILHCIKTVHPLYQNRTSLYLLLA